MDETRSIMTKKNWRKLLATILFLLLTGAIAWAIFALVVTFGLTAFVMVIIAKMLTFIGSMSWGSIPIDLLMDAGAVALAAIIFVSMKAIDWIEENIIDPSLDWISETTDDVISWFSSTNFTPFSQEA